MPEPERIILDYQDIAAWAVKEHGIHKGIWGIYVRFGLQVANTQVEFEGETLTRPTTINPLLELGIQPYRDVNNLSVDAAVVNPTVKKGSQKASKKAGKRK